MTDETKTPEEIFNEESAALALALYQKLGTSVYEFLHAERAKNTLTSGSELNFTQKDFIISILSFSATECLRILSMTKDTMSVDIINDLVRLFRSQLDIQLKESKAAEKPAETNH